ncbi:MAG: hypothetical protein AAB619_00185 [Patescibacteria group bacterium]
MGPEDREPKDTGFEDEETEHEVDDRVGREYVKDPPDDEKPETPEVVTGDVGDNESNEAPALGDEESDVENEQ